MTENLANKIALLSLAALLASCGQSQADGGASASASVLGQANAAAICQAAGATALPRATSYSYSFNVSHDGPTYLYGGGVFAYDAPFHGSPNQVVDAQAPYDTELVAETGKTLHLRYTGGIANRFHDTEAFKLFVGYKIDGRDAYLEMARYDSPSTTYTAYTADLAVPVAERGMAIWFEGRYLVAGAEVKVYDSNASKNYDVQVVTADAKSLCFDRGWNEGATTEVRAGDTVELVYDVARLIDRMMGPTYAAWPAWSAYAHFEVRDASGRTLDSGRLPLFATAVNPSNGSSSTRRPSYKPLLKTSPDAAGGELVLWFEGPNRGPTEWDSDLQANYHLPLR
jgi:hypothetical protein